MSFWGWIGSFIISSGILMFLLKWWKANIDIKKRNRSDNAQNLLEKTEDIRKIAHAALEVIVKNSGQPQYKKMASLLWTATSPAELLSNWRKYYCILQKNKKTCPLLRRFEDSVEQLRQAARAWYDADQKWRTSIGLAKGETMIGGKADEDTPERAEKQTLANEYQKVFDTFSVVYQELQSNMRPLIIVNGVPC